MKKFKISKKALSYIILIFSLLIFLVAYGLIIGGEIDAIFWIGEFLFLLLTITYISKKHHNSENRFVKTDWTNIFVLSLILLIGSHTFYCNVNKISYTTVRTYHTVVNEVMYRGGGTAWFYNPEGVEKSVEIRDYRIIVVDETTLISEGDTILIEEREGIFDVKYEILKNN